MRKTFRLILAIAVIFSLTVPVFAASDITWDKDTTLTKFINAYDNVTVKSGVTITMKEFKPDPQGLEIKKSLTVEPGGTIKGPGCIIFEREAACTGFDLYYIAGGVEKLLSVSISELIKQFPQDDYKPTFLWNSSTGHYVLSGSFDNDPFDRGGDPADQGTVGGNRMEECANMLKQLGLFLGTEKGFELERKPTRVEAVVMLIRLLGKEAEVKEGSFSHPFSDVPSWADKYIGYAYENGLANGIGEGKFGTGDATTQMFVTFVLRAMGYLDDTKGGSDFTYAAAIKFAENNGLIAGEGDINNFSRGTCASIMESALRQSMKGGTRLWEKLVRDGVFTETQYNEAAAMVH